MLDTAQKAAQWTVVSVKDGRRTSVHCGRCRSNEEKRLAFWRARYAACVTARFVTSGPGSLQLRGLPPLPDIAAPIHSADHLKRTYAGGNASLTRNDPGPIRDRTMAEGRGA